MQYCMPWTFQYSARGAARREAEAPACGWPNVADMGHETAAVAPDGAAGWPASGTRGSGDAAALSSSIDLFMLRGLRVGEVAC